MSASSCRSGKAAEYLRQKDPGPGLVRAQVGSPAHAAGLAVYVVRHLGGDAPVGGGRAGADVIVTVVGVEEGRAAAVVDGAGQDGAVEDYLNFLRAGGSMYPLDALRLGGVDLSTPKAVEVTFGVLSSLVDRLESLLA